MLEPHCTAAALLQRYAVWGKYYELTIGADKLPMRSHLELFAHTLTPEAATLGTPDAVAVMMNPGSSQALPSLSKINGYLPAKPDTTQYQLMRVMQAVGWQHVRVLNLSDFRAPKSKDFLSFLAQHPDDDAHSIFAASRSAELNAALGDCPNVVLGWGVAPAFEPWARRVLAVVGGVNGLKTRRLLGLRGSQDWMYKHPLPLAQPAAQAHWVAQVTAQQRRAA